MYRPLAPEYLVGVAPPIPPMPRLTGIPSKRPMVAHKSTKAPPQLVVIAVAVAPGGRVIGPVIDPKPLVIEAISLDALDRIELAGSVIWLTMEEMTLGGLTAVLIPLISDTNEEATLVGTTLVGSPVI